MFWFPPERPPVFSTAQSRTYADTPFACKIHPASAADDLDGDGIFDVDDPCPNDPTNACDFPVVQEKFPDRRSKFPASVAGILEVESTNPWYERVCPGI